MSTPSARSNIKIKSNPLGFLKKSLFNLRVKSPFPIKRSFTYYDTQFPIYPAITDQSILKKARSWQLSRADLKRIDYFIERIEDERVLVFHKGIGLLPSYLSQYENVTEILSITPDPYLHLYNNEVYRKNNKSNIVSRLGTISSNEEQEVDYFLRSEFWSSSTRSEDGPHKQTVKVNAYNLDALIEDFRPTFIIYNEDLCDEATLKKISDLSIRKLKVLDDDEKYIVSNNIIVPIDKEVISPKLIRTIKRGNYERDEASKINQIIKEGERILELGAGIGFISAICGKNKAVEKMLLYEANPVLKPYIEEVHSLNNVTNSKVRSGVLLNNSGQETIPFYIRQDFWASSLGQNYGFKEKIDVPVYKFNHVLKEFKPTLIICDIEGGELDLFRNSRLAMNGVEKIYMEIHQRVLGRGGILELFKILQSKGYHYDQYYSSHNVILFSHISLIDPYFVKTKKSHSQEIKA